MVLDIAAFGENKPELLPWLTLPPKGNLVLAQQLLMSLNALTPDHDAHALSGSITAEGSRMAQLLLLSSARHFMLRLSRVKAECFR
jgi:ATP-dependent helicase HrpB